jgi:uncharacterized protein (TIGR01777 family)
MQPKEIAMKIALSGSTGFVGSHLSNTLKQQGHQVIALGRADFNSDAQHLAERIKGCDVVINLAGESINHRWTPSYKQSMVTSRVDTTRLLVKAMKSLEKPPQSFISTSALGAFDGHERYTEKNPPNAVDFLGELAKAWEAAAYEAEELGIRTLIFRFALVLGEDGGLMKQLLLPFRLGLGGPIGDGTQAFSWIHIDDLVDAYCFILNEPSLKGVFHLAAPNPVTNLEFTHILGSVLRRPTFFRVPYTLLKLFYGEAADAMTSGQWVVSQRLPEAGYQFHYPDLESAIEHLVARSRQNK